MHGIKSCNESHLHTVENHLLTDFDQPWLPPANLQRFAEMIHRKGGALQNCWGFVDGTVRPTGRNMGVLYNGHKKVHSIKFQSVVAPSIKRTR